MNRGLGCSQWAVGKGLFGEATAQAKAWIGLRRVELRDGRVDAVIAALKAEIAKPGGRAAEEEIQHYETNRDRMRYQELRAKGYPVEAMR